MAFVDKMVVGLVGVIAFLASIVAAVRGGFLFPVELFLLAAIGVLLVVSLAEYDDPVVSSFLSVLLFITLIANIGYLYSVAGYLNTIRMGTLGLAVIGLLMGTNSFVGAPEPQLRSEVKRLIAAEKQLESAQEKASVKEKGKARLRKRK